jgi:radical SAM protein with 4Fe4S-binding SPASM domain
VLDELPAIAEMIGERGIKLWALFLLIAVGRAARPEVRRLNLSARQFELLFHWLCDLEKSASFDVTPREGYHYRRVLLQRRAAEVGITVENLLCEVEKKHSTPADVRTSPKATRILRAPLGVNDGKGIVFISHQGDVQPSGFLNLVGGNIRREPLASIYRNSPLFLRLRDSSLIEGKCGVCEFKNICGGSRSRAYAITGNPMHSDPFCAYQPAAWRAAANGKAEREDQPARRI